MNFENLKKIICLDTETTGLDIEEGHRVVEIGAVLLHGRTKTNEEFHTFLNPERKMGEGAKNITGYTDDMLIEQPFFRDIAEDFLTFISGSKLVMHNAPFDVGHLNNELKIASSSLPLIEDVVDEIVDTVILSREVFGHRMTLDGLMKKFDINDYDRAQHGGLKDANILADAYGFLTGGQSNIDFSADNKDTRDQKSDGASSSTYTNPNNIKLKKILTSKEEEQIHIKRLQQMEESSGVKPIGFENEDY